MENTFKSSVFGGFNRDDVIRYIEKTSLENKEHIETLEQENDGLCRENADLRTEASSAAQERDRLADANRELSAQIDALKSAADEAAAQISSLRAQADALEQEKAELLTQIAHLQPQADEYAAVKSHISEIELSARQRADTLESSTRSQLCALIAACRKQCDLVTSTLNTTCENLSGELRRLDASVTQLPSAFNTLRKDLDDLDNIEQA